MQRVLDFDSDIYDDFNQFELELDHGEHLSPNKTRSGKLHGEHPESLKRRSRVGEGIRMSAQKCGDGDTADSEENIDEVGIGEGCSVPADSFLPGRLFSLTREKRHQHDLPSSPVRASSPPSSHPFPSSPRSIARPLSFFKSPVSSLDTDVLLSPTFACTLSSSLPQRHLSSTARSRSSLSRARLRFDTDGDLLPSSCPVPTHSSPSKASPVQAANINPFTPQAMHEAAKRRRQDQSNSSWGMSQSDHSSQNLSMSLSDESEQDTSLPAKRLRVSDMSITRYQEEFLEIAKIASGQFGMVVKARHKLDGIVYAIKITKKNLRANSIDEKMAMNEVFAHAALMKNKHVLRYYNSWVERGQIFIQNEFCDGGSLDQKLSDARKDGQVFRY